MSSQTATPQVNGAPSSSAATNSQPASTQPTTATAPSQSQTATNPSQSQSSTQPTTQGTAGTQQGQAQGQGQQPPLSPSTAAPRPRDARMIELLLTSQGVTSYEPRTPLLLLDFAYRHSSSILNDAIHLAADPYTSSAGSKSNAAASIPGTGGDATVSANAVKLAIGARLHYQFRGGGGAGGISKDWLQDLAKERNRVALPKVAANEWGVRLPSERFVLSGTSWGLQEMWEEAGMEEDESEEEEEEAAKAAAAKDSGAMEGVEATDAVEDDDEDIGGEDPEGGTMEDVFGRDANANASAEVKEDPDTEMGESR